MRQATDTSEGPEELLQHAGWLRELARSLVFDAQTADDLVQDTWVAALRNPPQHFVRPWLGRVLRNAARQLLRGEGRRARRERTAAQHETLPSAQELAAQMELQRMLVDCVLGLEEPYRSTVVLRFYEGLSAAEIARRQNRPGATVRSHLKRGLDELRRRLDERHGGSHAQWSTILIPWLSMKPKVAAADGSAATALVGGVLTMSMGIKLSVGTSAIALAITGYHFTRPNPQAHLPPGELTGSPDTTSLARVGVGRELTRVEPTGVGRRAVTQTSSFEPREAGLKTPTPQIEAEVVDEHLRPLAGAVLSIARLDVASPVTGPDGRILLDLELEEEGRYKLKVAREGYVAKVLPTTLKPGTPARLGRIILQPGGRIVGTVVDQDAIPVAGAQIFVTRPDLRMSPSVMRRTGPDVYGGVLERRSDADGRFTIDGVSEQQVRVWAGARDALWALSDPIEVESDGEPVELVLVLEVPEVNEALEGIVLAPDGSPVPDCSVRCDFRGAALYFTRWATTDVDGRFGFLAVPAARSDFRAEDPEERWSDAVHQDASAGTAAVLRFREPRMLNIVVLNTEGDAMSDATVQAIARFERDTTSVGSGVCDKQDSGVVLLREPAEKFFLSVSAPNHADFETGDFLPGDFPDPFTVNLEKLPGIHGRVMIGKRPATGVRMKLANRFVEVGGWFQVVHHKGFMTELDPHARFGVVTDDKGRFQFAPQESGDYVLRAEHDDFAPGELRIREYDPAIGMRDLEILLSEGGHLEGEVTPSPGSNVAGTLVVISRGDAHELSMHVGTDGIYHFEQLIPGRWNVEVIEDELENIGTYHTISKDPVELPWVCEVFEGETTYHDLDLSGRESCTLTGFFTVNDEPAGKWTISLRTLHGPGNRPSMNPQALLGEDGGFELSVPQAGTYYLSLQSPQNEPELLIQSEIALGPGTRTWEFALETGRVEIENIPRADAVEDSVFLFWSGPNDTSCFRRLEPDARGRCTIERFPSGKIRFGRSAPGAWNPDVDRTLLTGNVEAGRTTRFAIP